MSVIDTVAGAILGVYVGDWGNSASAQVLTRINSIRTNGANPKDFTPTEWVKGINQRCQTGPREISFDLTFYTDSGIVYNLARNLLVGETDLNAVSDPSRKYVLMLINDSTKLSFLFPEISVELDDEVNYEKDNPTITTVKFITNSIPLDYDLVYRGTGAAVNAHLPAARRPF